MSARHCSGAKVPYFSDNEIDLILLHLIYMNGRNSYTCNWIKRNYSGIIEFEHRLFTHKVRLTSAVFCVTFILYLIIFYH